MTNDLFELVNSLDLNYKEFLERHYNFIWKKNKTVCPFHDDSETSPSLSYSPKKKILHCFVCNGGGGDLINFIRDYKNISKLEACMEILDLEGISYERPEQETTSETVEEMKARQEEFKKKQEEYAKRKEKKQKEEKALKQKAIDYMTKKATILSKNLDVFSTHSRELNKLFFNQSDIFLQWLDLYVGYDDKHDSICILNRILDDNFTTYNIKHRLKYEWNEEKKIHLDKRVDGKWIGYSDSTTYAFPYEFYKEKSKSDNTVFIVEGEKDALNLLSYDINVLTLGGVNTSWLKHKEILKDKTIYIWFDHDNAGYKNAIKKYNELKDISNEIFIVLFYQINSSLSNKYDISDFIFDNKFANKEELLDKIKFAISKLTTSLIEEIEDITGLDLKEYYFNQNVKTFFDIKKNWSLKDKDGIPLYITNVKGEKDIKGLDSFFDDFKLLKNSQDFNDIKDNLAEELVQDKDIIKAKNIIQNEVKNTDGHTDIQSDPLKLAQEKKKDTIDIFNNVIKNFETIYKDYRQTHISDMVEAFENMAKKTDNTFAKYNGKLNVWTGTHYHELDEDIDDIKRFILKNWMPLARVDKKKWSTQNVEKILEDIFTGGISVNEIKDNQKNIRVINFTNGTLFISKKGKLTFKNIHSKKDGATNILNFEYKENATCPKWQKFLKRVLPNEKDQRTLMEFIGYCFLPSHNYEAFLYMHGKSGANGKSVIMDVIKSFFGKENTSSLDLQDFEGHKLEALENKIINIGSEVDGKGLNKGQLSKLKALTATKDDISIDPKNKKPRTLESDNQPKLIFAGQGKPNPSSMDDGVFRRMLLLTFDSEIKDDEKVANLSERFEDETSGILCLALQNLQNLIKQGSFTKSDKLLENIEEYKDQTNPVRRYIKDCIELDAEVIIPKDFLYSHYKEYMTEKGNIPLSQAKFFTRLKDEIKEVEDIGQQRIDIPNIEKDRPRFIKGIFCNDDDIFSFKYEKEDIHTKTINYDFVTKQVVIKDKVKNDE